MDPPQGFNWFHGPMSREDADALLKAGVNPDGTYLVRTRPGKPQEYILGLVFRGKATHHLMTMDDSRGYVVINKKQIGECRTIQELVKLLSEPCKGWPCVLSNAIKSEGPVASAVERSAPSSRRESAMESVTSAESPRRNSRRDSAYSRGSEQYTVSNDGAPLAESAYEGGSSEYPPYLHPAMTRQEADELCGTENGNWFVRERKAEQTDLEAYVLVIVYKNKITHHLLQQQEGTRVFKLNGKPTNKSTTLDGVIQFLQGMPKGWPVTFGKMIPYEDPANSGGAVTAVAPIAVPEPDYEDEPAPAPVEPEPERRVESPKPQEVKQTHEEKKAESREEKPKQEVEEDETTKRRKASKRRRELAEQRKLEKERMSQILAGQKAAESNSEFNPSSSSAAVPVVFDREFTEKEIAAFYTNGPHRELTLIRNSRDEPFGFGVGQRDPPHANTIVPNGIAENAGMQPGDVIVKVDDESTRGYDYQKTVTALSKAGTTLVVTVVRPSESSTDEGIDSDRKVQAAAVTTSTKTLNTERQQRSLPVYEYNRRTKIIRQDPKFRLPREDVYPEDGYFSDE